MQHSYKKKEQVNVNGANSFKKRKAKLETVSQRIYIQMNKQQEKNRGFDLSAGYSARRRRALKNTRP
jgi:hypothetical protein